MRTWQSQDACALSRHCEPCKQSSWSRARNSRRTCLSSQLVVWVPEVPPGPLLFHEKGSNLHPSKCQVPNHGWVDWWGWWEADGKTRWKNCQSGAWNSRTSGPEPRTQSLHLTATTTHTHTHTHTQTQRGITINSSVTFKLHECSEKSTNYE